MQPSSDFRNWRTALRRQAGEPSLSADLRRSGAMLEGSYPAQSCLPHVVSPQGDSWITRPPPRQPLIVRLWPSALSAFSAALRTAGPGRLTSVGGERPACQSASKILHAETHRRLEIQETARSHDAIAGLGRKVIHMTDREAACSCGQLQVTVRGDPCASPCATASNASGVREALSAFRHSIREIKSGSLRASPNDMCVEQIAVQL